MLNLRLQLILLLLLPFSPVFSAAEPNNPPKRYNLCKLGLLGLKTGKHHAGQKMAQGWEWAKKSVVNSDKIPNKEYDELRKRTVGSYFPGGKITDETKKSFFEDFEKVLKNYDRMEMKNHGLFPLEDVEQKWSHVKEDRMKWAFVKMEKNKTLLDILNDLSYEFLRPPEHIPFKDKVKEKALAALWPHLLGVRPVARFVFKESWSSTKFLVSTALVGAYLAIVLNPTRDFLDAKAYKNFGWVGIKWSLFLSDIDKAANAVKGVMDVNVKMEKLTKFDLEDMTPEEGMKVFGQLEEAWLEYYREFSAVVPSNFASGRALMKDGAIMNPLTFVTATSAVQGEINDFERDIRELERFQRENGDLDEQDAAFLEKTKQRLGNSHKRMGAVLAAIRIHEMMYPEHTRASFMRGDANNKLFNTYKTLMKAINIKDYQEAYLDEMNSVLKDMEITLNTMKKEKEGKK